MNKRNVQQIKLVRNTVDDRRAKPRIRKNYLLLIKCSRVAIKGCLNIRISVLSDLRDLLEELERQLLSHIAELLVGVALACARLAPALSLLTIIYRACFALILNFPAIIYYACFAPVLNIPIQHVLKCNLVQPVLKRDLNLFPKVVDNVLDQYRQSVIVVVALIDLTPVIPRKYNMHQFIQYIDDRVLIRLSVNISFIDIAVAFVILQDVVHDLLNFRF